MRGRWRVDPAALDALDHSAHERTHLLAPFDVTLHDRKRMADLLGFDYALKMYKTQAKCRWGYYALPCCTVICWGNVDASANYEAGELRVHAIHEHEPFDADLRSVVEVKITELARLLNLTAAEAPHAP